MKNEKARGGKSQLEYSEKGTNSWIKVPKNHIIIWKRRYVLPNTKPHNFIFFNMP